MKSTFTSVPVEEAMEKVETVLQQIYQMLGTQTTLEKDEIISLQKLCTETIFFNTRTSFLEKKKHGKPRGFPVSVVIAETMV